MTVSRCRRSLEPGRLPIAVALALAFAALPALPAGDTLQQLRVSQVHQRLEADHVVVRAYLDIVDATGLAVAAVSPGDLTATLGDRQLSLGRLEPMRGSGEGVAYIFLVDISRSLSQTEFDRITTQIEGWIGALASADRAAIIAFGDQVRLVCDFTADPLELTRALASLGPTDGLTLLHRAISDGLELAQRRDPDLPGRRVLVVLTDGRDEGSGLTVDDVLARLRADPAPLYAIGYSRLSDPIQRQRYLDLLHRLATNSGGAFFDAGQAGFASAYGTIREAVERVWMAELDCSDCPADGREFRFQVSLASDGRVLSDGLGVRIFPPRGTASPPVAEPPAARTDTDVDRPQPTPDDATLDAEWRSWARWLLLPLAAAALTLLASLVASFTWHRRRWQRAQASPPSEPETPSPYPSPPPETAPGAAAAAVPERRSPSAATPARSGARPSPGPLRALRLIVVRGSRPGREYRLVLHERAVVGARSTCDCVLIDEPNVQPEQFELRQRRGGIYATNLAEVHPTLLGGFPLEEHAPVRSGDLIGNGDLILRLVYD